MKRYFIWLSSLVFIGQLQAQVVLNPQLPPGGLTVKSQLWNLSVVNTGNTTMQGQIELSMVDVSSGQPVLTATTRIMDFPKGLKQVRAGEAAPVMYNVTGSYRIDGSAEGFLPVGNFQLCYTLIRQDLEAQERVAEACETVVIEPISPPQLVQPSDSEYVLLSRPLFNWLPPAPIQLFGNLNYDFKLVEVQSLQTGAEAIQDNMPLHIQSNLNTSTLLYPPSLPELDTAKLYAWQITARSGSAEVAKSEIWTFRLQGPVVDPVKHPGIYFTRLSREENAGYSSCWGVLRYAYINETNDVQTPFRIIDISNAARRDVVLDSTLLDLHFGQNLGELDLSNNKLQDKHIYLLELTNARRERWTLKFLYRKPH